MGRLGLALAAVLMLPMGACATMGQCPEPYAYCEGNVRHYCVSHQGAVVPDFTVSWETQDCSAQEVPQRCVEEGNDAICQ